MIDGACIRFPEIEVSLGLRVSVRSRKIKGRNLLWMIYGQKTQGFALDMAIVALKALDRADVTLEPFTLFGKTYGWIRRLKVTLSERLGASILSLEQRAKLNCLASSYVKIRKGERKVLVHGDLHAGNLVVNRAERSLGFVDLEMMHLGKPATNFAQLWISFHIADPSLGQRFFQRYMDQFLETLSEHFDSDVRAEVALRCYSMVAGARKSGNTELADKAHTLLGNVLSGGSLKEFVFSQNPTHLGHQCG